MALTNVATSIEKFIPRVLDDVLTQESLTERLFGKNALKVDFLDAKTCKVFKLATTGLTTYARGGHGSSNTKGGFDSTTETFTLGQERFTEIPVDKLDSVDDAETVLSALSKEFIRVHVVQEFDCYRLSKLASYTSVTFGNRVSEAISDNTIISKFNSAFHWLKNAKVSDKHQIIYCSTSVMEKIRNTSEIAKRVVTTQEKIGDYYTSVERYEGRQIIEVPEDLFYTNAVVGDGFYPASDSYIINFIVVDETAPIVVKKLDFVKIYSSEEVKLDYVGYAMQQLYYHDLFVPENKIPAIYCSVSTTKADTVANTLYVNAKASTTQGMTIVQNVLTGGKMYDKLYLATSSTKPTIGSSTSALTQIYLGTAFTPNASHNYIVASLDGHAVCVSKDFLGNLPVGA